MTPRPIFSGGGGLELWADFNFFLGINGRAVIINLQASKMGS